MKRNIIKIITVTAILLSISFGSFVVAQQAHAQAANPTTSGPTAGSGLNINIAAAQDAAAAAKKPSVNDKEDSTWTGRQIAKGMAWIANMMLTFAAILLRIAGTLLSMAMLMTLHISEIVNNNSSIGLVWRTIRDFSSIFFIFMLLYASIKMILGFDGGNFKKLVINIVICGLLINFSLFFTKVVVDASNVIALSFYNAIAPGEVVDMNDPTRYYKWSLNDNGISQVFMNALKIQTIYDAKGQLQGDNVHTKIIIAAIGGTALMVIAAMNFFAAAFMFIVRIGILILLMVFSPLYFLGMVIPELKSYSSKWFSTLIGQATFAPLYLILVYVSMKILTNPSFMQFMGSKDTGATFANAFLGTGSIGVFFQYGLTILFLTTALFVAKGFAGEAASYGDKMKGYFKKGMAKLSYDNALGRQVIGGSATWADSKLGNTWLGNSSVGRSVRGMTTGKLATTKYGDMTIKDRRALSRDIDKKNIEIKRADAFNEALNSNSLGSVALVGDAMKGMSGSQKSGLSYSALINPKTLMYLKKGDYEAIYKRDDLTDAQKDAIKDMRIKALSDAITNSSSNSGALKNMVENMTGEDLMKLASGDVTVDGQKINKKDLLVKDEVVAHLSASQLNGMEDMDSAVRLEIGTKIRDYQGANNKPHKAAGYITDKGKATWLGINP